LRQKSGIIFEPIGGGSAETGLCTCDGWRMGTTQAHENPPARLKMVAPIVMAFLIKSRPSTVSLRSRRLGARTSLRHA
jgi:hypothetical protein